MNTFSTEIVDGTAYLYEIFTLKSYPSVHISLTTYLFIVVDKLWTTNNPPTKIVSGLFHLLGDVLISQDPAVQVPSALEGLTVVFGMGTRGTPPLSPPNVQVFDHLKTRYETNLHFNEYLG